MDKVIYPADFEFRSTGYFSFKTDAVIDAIARKRDFPDMDSADTSRRLRAGDACRLTVGQGSYRQSLDMMVEGDNELIKNLDLSEPRDISAIRKNS